ncbi:MAG: sigma 54-interacting transcriptional regulator [Thermoanaerobaculia bacterium]|nr:sigma 54-interacting transcriptional regulator [Thermoanaerobaculia bacterium]
MTGSGPLPPSLDALRTAAPSLAELLRSAARAAASPATVLLLGEPGTGRSALARALHAASPRAAGPLVELDAGAVPSALFESELFGHVAGAFTGAREGAPGRVARAAGGSLLLDRVEEIPRGVQPKLLRLLSEGRYAPLGGREAVSDARILAVGAADLPARVRRGVFRRDLYFRLEVVTFELPPLRRRPQDLAPLAEHFLAELGERAGRPGLSLDPASRGWMADYRWPGNLRELRNVLERAVVLGDCPVVTPAEPAGLAGARPRRLAEVEEREIRRALAYTRGHQGRAAELLGISRKSLWERRKRYGIP